MEESLKKKRQSKDVDDSLTGKAIRISLKHHALIEKGRLTINQDPTYKKKISISRYIEKLVEDHWEKPIEDLKKEREGAKDWLEIEYKREAPEIPFFEWIRQRVEGSSKKVSKRSSGGEK